MATARLGKDVVDILDVTVSYGDRTIIKDVEWRIAPGERTGHYTLGLESPAGDSISAEDYAVALVDELEQPKHRRQRFTAAS
jgi:putative NADH-flavin reductase